MSAIGSFESQKHALNFTYKILEEGLPTKGIQGKVRILCESNSELRTFFAVIKDSDLSNLCVFEKDVDYDNKSLYEGAISLIAKVKLEQYNEGKTAHSIVEKLKLMGGRV
jgi:hypothetical protein